MAKHLFPPVEILHCAPPFSRVAATIRGGDRTALAARSGGGGPRLRVVADSPTRPSLLDGVLVVVIGWRRGEVAGMSSDYGGGGGKASFCASVGLRFIKKLKPVFYHVRDLRLVYGGGKTKSYDWRVSQLEALIKITTRHKGDIIEALFSDLKKPELEAFTHEGKVNEKVIFCPDPRGFKIYPPNPLLAKAIIHRLASCTATVASLYEASVESWAAPLSYAFKRYQSALPSRSEMLMRFEKIEFDEDTHDKYPCPFSSEYFDIVGFCCHIDDEHPAEAGNGLMFVQFVQRG
ncbi:hypothetical protein CASFOL_022879 [Castilleja foliolosa]|uniref:Di19 zinc-binding domain-containing protein n=1 Tax=Castilleja foliolosa TaxID=1961234 RepID=A0ABD3CV53_9LAMI